jgi:hypothetical protein
MKIFTSLLLILFCFSINTYAAEFKFVTGDNKSTTKACMAAVTDKTEVMISKLQMLSRRGTALSFRSFINTIKCNNQYIGNFALTYNAQNSFAYLDRYTNRSNKKRQANITIEDLANEQRKNMEKTIVVLVSSN